MVISLLTASNQTAQEVEVGSQNKTQKPILYVEPQFSNLRQNLTVRSCLILLKLVIVRNIVMLVENS